VPRNTYLRIRLGRNFKSANTYAARAKQKYLCRSTSILQSLALFALVLVDTLGKAVFIIPYQNHLVLLRFLLSFCLVGRISDTLPTCGRIVAKCNFYQIEGVLVGDLVELVLPEGETLIIIFGASIDRWILRSPPTLLSGSFSRFV